MYLMMVFDILADKPETQRICGAHELDGIAKMFRLAYPDKERYRILNIPAVLMAY